MARKCIEKYLETHKSTYIGRNTGVIVQYKQKKF